MEHKKQALSGRKILHFLLAAVLVILSLVVTLLATRWIVSLRDPAKLAAFQSLIDSFGFGGWLILLAIQYIQIVVAFIPGGPIQIIAGALYGPWSGLVICLLGTILASSTVFFLVSHFGTNIATKLAGKRDLAKYDFLGNSSKLEWAVFILFLIPGTPKDALTYAFALTPIKMSKFMVTSTIARLPAIIISLFAGQTIIDRQWGSAAIMFVIMGLFSVVGLVVHKKVMARIQKRNEIIED